MYSAEMQLYNYRNIFQYDYISITFRFSEDLYKNKTNHIKKLQQLQSLIPLNAVNNKMK